MMQLETLISPERLISSVFLSITGVGLAVIIVTFLITMLITRQITGIALRLGPALIYIIVTAVMAFQYFDVLLAQSIKAGLVDPSGSDSLIKSQLAFVIVAPLVWDLLLGACILYSN